MQAYQSTPDYYRDFIEHGWIKNQAAKAHKYIERWKNEAGFWRYRYQSKRLESQAKKARGPLSAETITKDARNGKMTRTKDAYKSRKTGISTSRQKAHESWLNKIRPIAAKNAKSSYESRKSSIKAARGNAHKAYGKKKFGILGYDEAYNKNHPKKKKNNKLIKTIYMKNGKPNGSR